MEDKAAIKVQNVSKDFSFSSDRASTVKGLFTGLLKKKSSEEKLQHALKNVSFEIKKGEFFGIVGRNGSGKSTLLKMMAGIYQPNKGNIEVDGRLVPFIELGVGFNPELTGKENVYLNGALLNFSEKEVDAFYKEVVEFAELEQFMDKKLKNYSSGMQVRLAFSMAIRAKADILLIDEVLAVGDEAFKRKCYEYFSNLKKEKKTVVFVSHDMDAVQQFCTKAFLVNDGEILTYGRPADAAQGYRRLNNEEGVVVDSDKPIDKKTNQSKYVDLKLKSQISSDKLIFDIKINQKITLNDPMVALGIYRDNGDQIYRWASDEKVDGAINLAKQNHFKLELENILPDGLFYLNMSVKSRDRTQEYGIFKSLATFRIQPRNSHVADEFWKLREKMEITNSDEK